MNGIVEHVFEERRSRVELRVELIGKAYMEQVGSILWIYFLAFNISQISKVLKYLE
jgi:hypothetical protein